MPRKIPSTIPALDGFTLGCDPELFILRNSDGVFVSAEGLLPGTKKEPYKVPNGAVQVDGMAAEFNIDPAHTFEEFDANIVSVLKTLQKMLPADHSLVALPAVEFSKEVWDKTPGKAKELGCSPDFNAWTGTVNPVPECKKRPRLRTASGHIHIGWTSGKTEDDMAHLNNCKDLVKQLDWFLGPWSLIKDENPDRRLLYGKAGACRYKDYGVEYRVLSNFWVMDKRLRREVWNRVNAAIRFIPVSFFPERVGMATRSYLIDSINTSSRNSSLERKFSFPIRTVPNDLNELMTLGGI